MSASRKSKIAIKSKQSARKRLKLVEKMPLSYLIKFAFDEANKEMTEIIQDEIRENKDTALFIESIRKAALRYGISTPEGFEQFLDSLDYT